MKLFLDIETYSDVPLTYGVHAYAQRAEILLVSYAIDDGQAEIIEDVYLPPKEFGDALNNPGCTVIMHNSGFDRIVMSIRNYAAIPVERIHDTMVQALAHGLPGGLGKLCEIFKIDGSHAKQDGRQLISLFCKPRPKNSKLRRATHETHPAEWEKFKEYAKADIEATRAIYNKLPKWNNTPSEIALWRLDQQINDRGFQVDTELVEAAIRAIDTAQEGLARKTSDASFGLLGSTTQRDATLRYIAGAYGVYLPDLQASTLERRLQDEELPQALKEVFANRLQASSTSTSKYRVLRNATSLDGRLRGTLQFCGASRTGRWSGRIFQPQNLPRPVYSQEDMGRGIDSLKADCAELFFDNIMSLTSSVIRGCIIAPSGKKLVISDLANIEGRVAAWLTGEEWKLQAFRDYDNGVGEDLYKLAYAKAFRVPVDSVDKFQRQIGKVMELMLGYEGGVGAFITGAAAYGIDLEHLAEVAYPIIPERHKEDAMSFWAYAHTAKRTFDLPQKTFIVCDALKRMWREQHPNMAGYWGSLKRAVQNAIFNPDLEILVGKVRVVRNKNWLRIILPSGRSLCYAAPRVENDEITYKGVNTYTRKWQDIPTYGGKLFENICQAVARDVMAANMPGIERAGYDIVLSVHDEIITEAPDVAGYCERDLSFYLAYPPEWARDLPLAASGFETLRYRKD